MIPDFSVLCDAHSKGAVVLLVEDEVNRFALLKGQVDEATAVRCRPTAGRHWFDVVATDTIVSYAISARMRSVLREAQANGWHTRKIAANGVMVEGHELLVVTGRCGPVDNKRSAFEMRQSKRGVGYPVWTGLFFDPTTWDGSDVFCPSDSGMIFITERVCEAIRKAKLENVLLRRGIDFERNAL